MKSLAAKYVISPIDGQRYCRKNGSFVRHFRKHGFDSYLELCQEYYPDQIEYCGCGKTCTLLQATMTFRHSCGSQECTNKAISNAKQNFTEEQHENRRNAYLKTMSEKTDDELKMMRAKQKQTCLERYGYEHAWANPDVREQIANTMTERYGAANYSTSLISNEVYDLLFDKEWLEEQHITRRRTLWDISQELGISDLTVAKYARQLGVELTNYNEPQWERDLADLLTEWGIEYERSVRILGTREVDFLLTEHNLAIELCGLFWHSDCHPRITTVYHANKQQECEKQGIQLLTIFEDEWIEKKDIVLSKIRYMVGLTSDRVFARKTKVVEISKDEKKAFLDTNHIQGNDNSTIAYGLEFEGEVVAVASFLKQQEEWELTRFATSVNVVGGFSKLLKHFEKEWQPTSIKTFADLRWSNGDLYEQTGFINDHILPPDYSYVIKGERFHKFNFRRDRIEKWEGFDPQLSERENMINFGATRIWDCGKKRYIKTL